MPDVEALHNSVATAAVAAEALPPTPIIGVSVGDWLDRATWKITFDPAATAAQRSAAQTALQNYNTNTLTKDDARKKTFTDDQQITNWTNQLASMSSSDIDAWFAANVTNNAQAIAALKNLAKIILTSA